MKPSEALTAIAMLGSIVTDLEARAEGARALDTSIRSELDARTIDLETAGERAAALVTEEYGGPDELAPFDGLVADAPIPCKLANVPATDWAVGDRVRHTESGRIRILTEGSRYFFKSTGDDGEPWELSPDFLTANFTLVDRAPYGRKADGTPKKAPGRKTRAAIDSMSATREEVERAGKIVPIDSTGVGIEFGAPPKSPEGPPLVAVGGPKAHVAPLTSPLTDELRAKLERTLGAAPMTAESIARMSWAADLDAERITALLCDAPETFIRWEREERVGTALTKVDVWGLPRQFDRAVLALTVSRSAGQLAWSQAVSAALGCSVSAALAAWKRLDPEAT